MDQVRPMSFQQGFATARFRLADLLLIQPHQVAAERRPRTEERPRATGSRLRGIDHPTARDRRDDNLMSEVAEHAFQ